MTGKLFISLIVMVLLTVNPKPGLAGNWWDKHGEPRYGDRISIRVDSMAPALDTGTSLGVTQYAYWFDIPFMPDWSLDRDIWGFKVFNVPELEYWQGQLVESFEWPDPQTVVYHVRKGIHWQDKNPVNGREFTAYDLEYQWHRMYGMGSGFTERIPRVPSIGDLESITATDKYTVVMKFKAPSVLLQFLVMSNSRIQARESVETEGGLTDWHLAAGTGPWLLTDWNEGISITYARNPDYWGYDERHPKNRLPYANEIKQVVIPDIATAMAAMRTGKVDFMSMIPRQQAQNFASSNPKIKLAALPRHGTYLDMRVDKKPFNDIRVRKALNMSIDRKMIADTFYQGKVDPIPRGALSHTYHKGWCTPFEEWPEKLQSEYSYNREKAKQLLAEAGYPHGFSTNVLTSGRFDIELLQIVKSSFMDIGVDMEIKVMEHNIYQSMLQSNKNDQMNSTQFSHGALGFWMQLDFYNRMDRTHNDDSVYKGMLDQIYSVTDMNELRRLSIEANQRVIEQHWTVSVLPGIIYNVYQPYLKGYSGEETYEYSPYYFSRMWIDKAQKKTMGY